MRRGARNPRRRRGAAARLALALAGLVLGGSALAQDPKPQPVKNPYWGVALFDLYQERNFAALTGLMAAQHFDRVPLHADEAELLRGALLLDIGVHGEAERVFTRLIDAGVAPAVRDRVWFHLARLRHRKGLNRAAEDALARIGGPLRGELEVQRALLQAQLQMDRRDFAGAAGTLAAVPPASPLRPYASFNLAIARLEAGDAPGGSALLQELGTQPMPDDELRSLRDKANLALGLSALRDGDTAAAVAALERVRLQGPQSHAALLGFGWAALQRKDPQRALVAFRELGARDLRDAAVIEARIAEPHALAQAGAAGAALQGYEQAIAAFTQEHARLDAAIGRVRDGALIERLLGLQAPERMGGAPRLSIDSTLPQAGLLAPLLAQHDLQQALGDTRDLRLAAVNLSQWAQRLDIFEDMLAQRRGAFEQRVPEVRGRAGALDLPVRRAQIDLLAAELGQARDAADGLAHAGERDRALQQRIVRARDALAVLDGSQRARVSERLRLAEGTLRWQLARDYPARQWQARQDLAAVEAAWAEGSRRAAALERAQREEPQRLQLLAGRIGALRTRVATLAPRVAALAAEQQGRAQELAIAALAREQQRLASYSEQARWAIAQLHDRARHAQRPDGGTDATR